MIFEARIVKPDFYDNLLKGNFYKDIVECILNKSGYYVLPFGYESFLPSIKQMMKETIDRDTDTAKKIRSSPDRVVVDPEKKTVELVEIKGRNWDKPKNCKLKLKYYKRYWPEAILVVIICDKVCFYAQRIKEIELKDNEQYNLESGFKNFMDYFNKVDKNTLFQFKQHVFDFCHREIKGLNN